MLRYTRNDRSRPTAACSATAAPRCRSARGPTPISTVLFTHFINQVTLFWRDKRISDVIRERAYDPSFGTIAIVRRAGLDLRNNLKWTSFGHLNVLRVEVMQLLDEAFKILNADDVKRLFGADNAWDVVEEVLIRYFNERLVTSPRQRMGVTGREVLRWLAQPHILKTTRPVRDAAARDRRVRRGVAHQRPGDGAFRNSGCGNLLDEGHTNPGHRQQRGAPDPLTRRAMAGLGLRPPDPYHIETGVIRPDSVVAAATGDSRAPHSKG